MENKSEHAWEINSYINIYLLKNSCMFSLKMWAVSITCILFLSAVICNPVVRITNGAIKGQTLKSRDGRDFYSFTSIPYAKPPINELRFKVNFIETLDEIQ